VGDVGGPYRPHRGRYPVLFNSRGHRGTDPRLHDRLWMRRQIKWSTKDILREIVLKRSVAHCLPGCEPRHNMKPTEGRLPAGRGISRAVHLIQYVATVLAQPTQTIVSDINIGTTTHQRPERAPGIVIVDVIRFRLSRAFAIEEINDHSPARVFWL